MGDFRGHVIPGTFFFLIGLGNLLLLLHRARTLENLRSSFPEINEKVLRFQGSIIAAMCIFGDLFEGLGGVRFHAGFFFQSAHLALYTIFLLPAVSMILESHSRLPIETSRKCFAISFLCEFLLFLQHGLMKSGAAKTFHVVLASIALLTSLTLTYSVQHPRSVFPQIMIPVLLVLQGLWFYTIALTFLGVHISNENVLPILIFEIFLIGFQILLISSKTRDSETESSISFAHACAGLNSKKKNGGRSVVEPMYETVSMGHVRIKSEDGLI